MLSLLYKNYYNDHTFRLIKAQQGKESAPIIED